MLKGLKFASSQARVALTNSSAFICSLWWGHSVLICMSYYLFSLATDGRIGVWLWNLSLCKVSEIIGSTGAHPTEPVIFLGGEICAISWYRDYKEINLVLLGIPLSCRINMYLVGKKFTEGIFCLKSTYFQGNSQLYSYVCCIKKSILNSYCAHLPRFIDMKQPIIPPK